MKYRVTAHIQIEVYGECEKIIKTNEVESYKEKNTTVTVDNDGMVSKRKYFLPHNWVVRGGYAHYAATVQVFEK